MRPAFLAIAFDIARPTENVALAGERNARHARHHVCKPGRDGECCVLQGVGDETAV
jgi:hypothetical protein